MANHNAQHESAGKGNYDTNVPGTMGVPLKPTVAPGPPTLAVQVRSWLTIAFFPFEPNDQGSSLHRKWVGHLLAKRSDGFVINITIRTLQSDGPQRVGQDLSRAFERLHSYLECQCTKQKVCSDHDETLKEPVDDGQ